MTAAGRAAEILIDCGAVAVASDKPFTLTSGRLSPVYVDCRRLISYLPARRELMAMAADMLRPLSFDYVAGGETAGIAYAAFLSELLDKPMLYVRKSPKGFGRGKRIEGHVTPPARALLVEDLATDGGSKIAFADALRAEGIAVGDVFSIFHYGIFPHGAAQLAAAGLTLHALCTWHDVLACLRARDTLPAPALQSLARFINDPEGWAA